MDEPVPHGERLILGSVAHDDDWDIEPRAEAILEHCAARELRVRDARILRRDAGSSTADDERAPPA